MNKKPIIEKALLLFGDFLSIGYEYGWLYTMTLMFTVHTLHSIDSEELYSRALFLSVGPLGK